LKYFRIAGTGSGIFLSPEKFIFLFF